MLIYFSERSNVHMSFLNRMKEPVFLKENSNVEEQLKTLKSLESQLDIKGKAILKRDINFLEYGMIGEKQINFELKNSHIPMYILHDIYLEDGDLSAQIDYLVFTRKVCFVIESKNLYGNIDINNAGDFIRTTEFAGQKKKEGIYSPITQNQRHMDLLKKIHISNKNNLLTKWLAKSGFEDFYKPVIVLSNPKTVLNAKYAKKEVKEKVIRADQLINYIKDTHNQSKEIASSFKQTRAWAEFYLNLHKVETKDYTKKYDRYKLNTNEIPDKLVIPSIEENTDLFEELKAYRLNKSREENIKAYYIYSNKELEALITMMPRTKEELQTVEGFGQIKIRKYGNDIINIINKYKLS